MPDAPSPADTAGIIGGAITLAGVIGAAIKWLFSRADQRSALLDRKEEALIAKLETRVKALEERDETREGQFQATLRKMDRLILVTRLLLDESEKHSPGSPIVAAAKLVLKRDFPEVLETDANVPGDMRATLAEIDRRTS